MLKIPSDKLIDTLELYKGLTEVQALADENTSRLLVDFLYDIIRDIAWNNIEPYEIEFAQACLTQIKAQGGNTDKELGVERIYRATHDGIVAGGLVRHIHYFMSFAHVYPDKDFGCDLDLLCAMLDKASDEQHHKDFNAAVKTFIIAKNE